MVQVVIKGKRKPKGVYDHERDKEMLEMLYKNDNKERDSYERAKSKGEKNDPVPNS